MSICEFRIGPGLVYQTHLVVDETGLLAAVLVEKVQGVTGELGTAILLALGEEAVVVACSLER
jgi:hypothetical protein